MRKILPNKQINVFHFEDGKEGLKSLIDFSDYIAISVPELRIVKPKTYAEDTYALASMIKNRKPEIDIHLLGCTQKSILERCTFCTSADSTSWLAGTKYGRVECTKRRIEDLKKDKLHEYEAKCRAISNALHLELRTFSTTTRRSICAEICKETYRQWCGNQD